MNNKINFFLIFSFLIFLAISLFSQDQDIDPKLQKEYNKKISYKKSVYDRTLKYIEENPNSTGLANLYFNLAEMSIEIDVNDPEITAMYYKKVLEHDPYFPSKDVVLYNIGYFDFAAKLLERDTERQKNIELVMNWPDNLRLSEEKLKTSIDAFSEIYQSMPESKYNTDAVYRLGTVYFEIALDSREPLPYFQKAIEYFDIVAQREGDPLQNYGLFQRGWSYFSSAQFELAIQDFTQILDIIHNDSLQTEKVFFEDDAIENIAFSLIDYDSSDFNQASVAAEKAKEILAEFISDEYSKEILLKSIELKLKYNAPIQAIDLINSYLSLYPLSPECPLFIDSVMTIYQNNPSRTRDKQPAEDLIVNEMIRIVDNYKVDSEWFKANAEKDLSAQFQVIRKAYEFLEPKYYNNFVHSKEEEDFITYKELVNDYLKFDSYIDKENLEKMKTIRRRVLDASLELAESTNNPSHYFSVLKDINDFNNLYPDHEEFYIFEDNIFYCNEKIYELLKPTIDEQAYIDTTWNVFLDNNSLDSLFIDASLHYEKILITPEYPGENKESDLIKLTYKRAEIWYDRNELDKAFADYSKLLDYNLDNEIRKLTNARLAEISQQRNDYNLAETYYREASKYATEDEKNDYSNNILASIQSNANTQMDKGDYLTAAENYLRLAGELENEDKEKSIGFKLKAIEAYKNAGDNQKAIDLLLDIASQKEAKEDILAVYINAWTISDSLGDWNQSERLRNQFIDKFNKSNEAYKLRLQNIGFYEGTQFDNKEKAAEMYLQLYEDAADMDIGEDNRENIYLNAIRIYQELGNENKEIELMLAFEEKHPNHPKSNEFLQKVALIYHDRGEEEKYDTLARKLYKKDPSIDLMSALAAEKLKDIKSEVDSLFVLKDYPGMDVKISEFKEVEASYKADGLDLPLESIYEVFAYYKSYEEFYNRFNDKIDYIENDFLKKSPQTLIKVNTLTKWKDHMIGGDDRINNLMKTCNKIKEDIIALIREGSSYELQVENQTHALYLTAKAYDYSMDVVTTQVQKFVDVSNQINNEQMKNQPDLQNKAKMTLLNAGKAKAGEFKLEAAKTYQQLLLTFYDGKNYSDEWTDKALNRLYEWDVRSEKYYDHLYSDASWIINNAQVDDYLYFLETDSLWSFANTTEDTVFEFAKVIEMNPEMNSYILINFNANDEPEMLTIDYAAEKPVQVIYNKEIIPIEPVVQDTINLSDNNIIHYTLQIEDNLYQGANNLVFKVENNASVTTPSYLAAHITIQYDKAKKEE
ncbi:MAG TPA: hypothetical protein ENL20_00975 [Candidatus Cloacimonetes bacterium]|nr:hypothetical protein [Candidatus Cloacimonadota bacterium]